MSFRTATTIITEPNGKRTKVVATYGVDMTTYSGDKSLSAPYVSVTGRVYYERPSGYFPREPDVCGQVVDYIARAFPWLRAFMDLHLSDARTGKPMYALENGWYFLNGEPDYKHKGKITEASRIKAAQYLRTAPDVLANVTSKDDLKTLIDNVLAPAWQQQMHTMLALYGFTNDDNLERKTDLNTLILLYTNDKGDTYEQPLSDLSEVGLLVDPETDEQLDLIGYRVE